MGWDMIKGGIILRVIWWERDGEQSNGAGKHLLLPPSNLHIPQPPNNSLEGWFSVKLSLPSWTMRSYYLWSWDRLQFWVLGRHQRSIKEFTDAYYLSYLVSPPYRIAQVGAQGPKWSPSEKVTLSSLSERIGCVGCEYSLAVPWSLLLSVWGNIQQ